MFFTIGHPLNLYGLGITTPDIQLLRRDNKVAVLDDEAFIPERQLRQHGFSIVELGGDIKSVDQISAYPIVVCDIMGVGIAFGSEHEGAHVLSEIQKNFPDKYLIAYTGMTHSVAVTNRLRKVDAVTPKDASIEIWVDLLEKALKEVGDPRQRWIRLRTSLLEKGAPLYDVFKMEQAFIKSMTNRNADILASAAKKSTISSEAKELVLKFAAFALVQLIAHAIE